MSAGLTLETVHGTGKRTDRLDLLAPLFRQSVELAVRECRDVGLLVKVFETYRSNALQAIYFARGRTVIPPPEPVTNAITNLNSWHGYGLAVDVVHETEFWSPPEGNGWFTRVADVFKKHGCKWGGDWKQKDLPHFQWGLCKPSPSDAAQLLLRTRGIQAVWEAVGAAAPDTPVLLQADAGAAAGATPAGGSMV